MRIESLTVQDMWSFGKPAQVIREFGETTIIIGPNNSGKSNIIKALGWLKVTEGWPTAEPGPLSGVAAHDYGSAGERTAEPELSLRISFCPSETDQIIRALGVDADVPDMVRDLRKGIQTGLRIKFMPGGDMDDQTKHPYDISYVNYDGDQAENSFNNVRVDRPSNQEWHRNFNTNIRVGIAQVFNTRLQLLDGWRSLPQMEEKGEHIGKRLGDMNAPNAQDSRERQQFRKVQDMFVGLTGLRDASLVPEAGGKNVNIDYRDRYLPITSFGDGIAHLLILAYEISRREGCVFLIEEPETHLHPGLQRVLLDFIRTDKRENQFILTSHSPVFLDSGTVEHVYQVGYDGNVSVISRCGTTRDLYSLLDALDVRASDILQANVTIWVEGPSDRIFLKRCLELVAPDLKEGFHYQIVLYGGSALAHITLDDDVDELVKILSLSRHAVLICDSDRNKEGDPLSPHKERLKEECEAKGRWFWVTAGREMENYISDRVLTEAFRECLNEPRLKIRLRMYDKLAEKVRELDLSGGEQGPKPNYGRNKVKVMRLVVKHLKETDLKQSDLSARLKELIEYIRRANGEKDQ